MLELEALYEELRQLQRESEQVHTLTKENKALITELEVGMENMKTAEGRHEEEFKVISGKLHEEIARYSDRAAVSTKRTHFLQNALSRSTALTDVL